MVAEVLAQARQVAVRRRGLDGGHLVRLQLLVDLVQVQRPALGAVLLLQVLDVLVHALFAQTPHDGCAPGRGAATECQEARRRINRGGGKK